ncbi:MAG: hypothetical protein OXE96_15500 [Gemmatimonadetes bacterium]|nr:hypothetical protein [Gemmatimonadota bacterium]
MVGEFFSWYVTSVGEFWSSAIRIGLPQILLVVLVICWLRRKGCGKSSDESCCWNWSWGFGSSGDESGSSCCPSEGCGCTCGQCCCQAASHDDGGDGADHDHE